MTTALRGLPLVPLLLLVVIVVIVTVAVTQATQPRPCRALSFEFHGTVVATTQPISFDGNTTRCS